MPLVPENSTTQNNNVLLLFYFLQCCGVSIFLTSNERNFILKIGIICSLLNKKLGDYVTDDFTNNNYCSLFALGE